MQSSEDALMADDDPLMIAIQEGDSRAFETLVSCLISLRTKDETTEAASARLFRLARTPRTMVRLTPRAIGKGSS